MTNEEILDIIRQCKIKDGIEILPQKAYLFKQKFKTKVSGKNRLSEEEIIVLVKDGIKAGGIYRMGIYDIHYVMKKNFEGQHILSDFLRTGILNQIWPENKSVELYDYHKKEDYEKKKHLADLCHMTIRNQDNIEKWFDYIEKQKALHS